MKSLVTFVLALASCTTVLYAQTTPKEWHDEVEKATNPCVAGSAPFLLQAAFVGLDDEGKEKNGQFALLWVSPDKWKRQESWNGFEQTTIRNGGKNYELHKQVYTPARVAWARESLPAGCIDSLNLPKWTTERGDEKATVDQAHGVVTLMYPHFEEDLQMVEMSSKHLIRNGDTVFFDFQQFRKVSVARQGMLKEAGQTAAVYKITGLADVNVGSDKIFDTTGFTEMPPVPTGNFVGPRIVMRAAIQTAYLDPSFHGTVYIRMTIDTKGMAHDFRIVRSSGSKTLDGQVRDGVHQFRYSPATRGGVPVECTFTTTYTFNGG